MSHPDLGVTLNTIAGCVRSEGKCQRWHTNTKHHKTCLQRINAAKELLMNNLDQTRTNQETV